MMKGTKQALKGVKHQLTGDTPAAIAAQIFVAFDRNANGTLSRAQFPLVVNWVMQKLDREVLCTQDIIDIFDLVDENGDQAICQQELAQFIELIQNLVKSHASALKQRRRQKRKQVYGAISVTSSEFSNFDT